MTRPSVPSERSRPRYVGPAEDDTLLRIEWPDGESSEYHPRYLRLSCPCARCVEEMTGRALLDPRRVPPDLHIREMRYVGEYALQFTFSDGHSTGIYPWEYLRDIALG
jgi:DUF971 family protein